MASGARLCVPDVRRYINIMKIAVDAMGGDYAPFTVVKGSVKAAKENIPIILVGDEARIEAELAKYDTKNLPISIRHCTEVVGMDESPAQAIRKKKDSSIRVALELVKAGEADGTVSAGNSGAAMASAMFVLKKLKGVERPAIAVSVPTKKEQAVLLDVGGNVDCRPNHLLQFAIMGSVYARHVLKKDSPSVGLLSNAEEEGKGNELTRLSHELIKKTSLNYIGYLEGKDIYSGKADVVVSDGFVGNVVLKLSEGLVDAVVDMLKKEIMASLGAQVGYMLARGAFKKLKKKIDYAEYGGAPLLGIDGDCMISHGASSPRAIKNAIKRAAEFLDGDVNERITEELGKYASMGEAESKQPA